MGIDTNPADSSSQDKHKSQNTERRALQMSVNHSCGHTRSWQTPSSSLSPHKAFFQPPVCEVWLWPCLPCSPQPCPRAPKVFSCWSLPGAVQCHE